MLVLDSVRIENLKDGECVDATLPKSFIQQVFKAYEDKGIVMARWYSGTLRLARGKMIRYVHAGWDRNYETEMELTVRNGRVVDSIEYHNKIVAKVSTSRAFPYRAGTVFSRGSVPYSKSIPSYKARSVSTSWYLISPSTHKAT